MTALIGHEAPRHFFTQAFSAGRFPHGLLFIGPNGVGKATTAYHLAQALLARDFTRFGQTEDRLMFSGNHPDFFVVEKEADETGKLPKDITIEKVRGLTRFFTQTSCGGNWRVALVDSVDDLTIRGANTLLKVLEEPPAESVLILIAHTLESVLPTIRSRCQVVPFFPLTTTETQEVLIAQGLPAGEAQFLAQVSAGRPGLGLLLAQLGGEAFYTRFLSLMGQIAEGDFKELYPFLATALFKNPALPTDEAYRAFCEFLVYWVGHACGKAMRQQTWGLPGEADVAQRLLAAQKPKDFVNTWFTMQRQLKTSHVFSLDKKHTLVCIFHSLAGGRI
jgi:DNA polymerase-3 subunit delta'